MNAAEVLADQIRRTREWTLLLLADWQGEDWTFQPVAGLQHALWICGHLAAAQDLLLFQRCLGRGRLDPAFAAHFRIGGPVPSAAEYNWPAPHEVRRQMDAMQEATLAAVQGLNDAFLAEPAYGKDGSRHPHYDTRLGAISHLHRHEAFHAGQLAMLRRLLGKPFLR